MLPLTAVVPSLSLFYSIPFYQYTTIYLIHVNGILNCSHFGVITSNAAGNIFVHILMPQTGIFAASMPRSGIVGSQHMHTFSKHCQIVFQSDYINFYSHMRVPVIQSLANTWSFFFLATLANIHI